MARSTHTLKLGEDPVLPGLGLPLAFNALEKRIETALQLCRLKSPVDAQINGLVSLCEELQRLLKVAFIENGMLASRIEMLTLHHEDAIKKFEKRLVNMEMEVKINRKHMKRMRKKVAACHTMQKVKSGDWWSVKVASSDYDSLTTLSRVSGSPDVEFMLRLNQLMIDFVKDKKSHELFLPPMGSDERSEIAKLASVYKIRCRYGKSIPVATSTLFKARQTCIPAAGEVDAVLNSFTKSMKRHEESGGDAKGGEKMSPEKEGSPSGKSCAGPGLSSSMLTPIPSSTLPLVDLTAATMAPNTPNQSPPSSATPFLLPGAEQGVTVRPLVAAAASSLPAPPDTHHHVMQLEKDKLPISMEASSLPKASSKTPHAVTHHSERPVPPLPSSPLASHAISWSKQDLKGGGGGGGVAASSCSGSSSSNAAVLVGTGHQLSSSSSSSSNIASVDASSSTTTQTSAHAPRSSSSSVRHQPLKMVVSPQPLLVTMIGKDGGGGSSSAPKKLPPPSSSSSSASPSSSPSVQKQQARAAPSETHQSQSHPSVNVASVPTTRQHLHHHHHQHHHHQAGSGNNKGTATTSGNASTSTSSAQQQKQQQQHSVSRSPLPAVVGPATVAGTSTRGTGGVGMGPVGAGLPGGERGGDPGPCALSTAAVALGPGPGPPGPGGAPPPPPKRLRLTRNSKGSAPEDDNT